MQFEKNELIDVVKQFIGIMKDSGLGYISVKNDKFELELGNKHPENAPITMPISMPSTVSVQTGAQPATVSQSAIVGKAVKSPIVGTFYAAPSPEKPPFIKVGDRINEGDVVCIVESMKVMNEIQAEVSGVVKEITVKNGETVEFDQPLIILE